MIDRFEVLIGGMLLGMQVGLFVVTIVVSL